MKVYLLIEQFRYVIPRRFRIIKIFDSPESAENEYKKYTKLIKSKYDAYEIKLEEWDVEEYEHQN